MSFHALFFRVKRPLESTSPPGYEKDWLKADHSLARVLHFLKPFASEKMNAYPVSELVNTPGANNPSMINPIGERLQSEEKPVGRINSLSRYYQKKKNSPDSSWGDSRMKSRGEGS